MTSTCYSNGVAPSYLDVDAVVEAALGVHKADPYAHPELKQVRQVVTSTGTAFDPVSGTQLRTAIDSIAACASAAAVADLKADPTAFPERVQVRTVITDAGLTYSGADPHQLTQAITKVVETHIAPDASESAKGITRLATVAEARAGSLNTVAVHPAGLKAVVEDLVNGAPASLNTLGELASAIGNDAAYAATVANQLALKAPLASPALTGVPTAPTPAAGDVTTAVATTAFVKGAVDSGIAALINGAPGALDTLKELAAALGNDASFAASVANQLTQKAPLASPALTGVPTAPTPAAGDASSTLATTAFVKGAVDGLGQTVMMPVGMECWYPGTSAPAGWLVENGALVSRAEYPLLWAFVQASGMMVSETNWQSGTANRAKFSSGDGTTTFRLPDLTTDGLFIRAQAGADADFGRRQEDELKSHTHGQYWASSGYAPGSSSGSYNTPTSDIRGSIVPTGGAETRPKNAGRLPIIKAH